MTFDELVKEVHRLAPKNAECRVEHTQTNRIGYKYSDDGSKEYWSYCLDNSLWTHINIDSGSRKLGAVGGGNGVGRKVIRPYRVAGKPTHSLVVRWIVDVV